MKGQISIEFTMLFVVMIILLSFMFSYYVGEREFIERNIATQQNKDMVNLLVVSINNAVLNPYRDYQIVVPKTACAITSNQNIIFCKTIDSEYSQSVITNALVLDEFQPGDTINIYNQGGIIHVVKV